MNKLKKLGIVIGLSALITCTINSCYKSKDICRDVPINKNRSEIEQIIDEDATAEEVFANIDSQITFDSKHDEEKFGCVDKWSSMQETYSLMTGDCEDGAILFKTMMSKNPAYKVEIIWLRPYEDKYEGETHSIDVYKKDGVWSYASFNENGLNHHCPEKFNSMHEAVKHFNKRQNNQFEQYAKIDQFTNEELKFSRNLNKHAGRNPNWINLD